MTVLILVLVDVGLGQDGRASVFTPFNRGLNPCFSGCWSRTPTHGGKLSVGAVVLILVLVDVGLGLGEFHRFFNVVEES